MVVVIPRERVEVARRDQLVPTGPRRAASSSKSSARRRRRGSRRPCAQRRMSLASMGIRPSVARAAGPATRSSSASRCTPGSRGGDRRARGRLGHRGRRSPKSTTCAVPGIVSSPLWLRDAERRHRPSVPVDAAPLPVTGRVRVEHVAVEVELRGTGRRTAAMSPRPPSQSCSSVVHVRDAQVAHAEHVGLTRGLRGLGAHVHVDELVVDGGVAVPAGESLSRARRSAARHRSRCRRTSPPPAADYGRHRLVCQALW